MAKNNGFEIEYNVCVPIPGREKRDKWLGELIPFLMSENQSMVVKLQDKRDVNRLYHSYQMYRNNKGLDFLIIKYPDENSVYVVKPDIRIEK